MSGGIRQLKQGDILFREGDPSDAMYVIKSGRIAITKAKGAGEIILAEKKTGEMLGEMAFFDNKPRSATAKAALDSQVIQLPFSSLYAQFSKFPEWLKAMVKTINNQLRDANQRIKNLEQASKEDPETFPPHLITRLTAIIVLVTYKIGEKVPEGLLVNQWTLRNYCIQVFQQPTNKLQRIMEVYQGLGYMKVEDLGEGKQKITVLKHAQMADFVDWYNEYLFKEESKRITVEEKEMPILRALIFYGRKEKPNEKGLTTVSLTDMQNNSMRDLQYLVGVNDADPLSSKGLTQEKVSIDGGKLVMSFVLKDLERIQPFWEIVFTLRKIQGRG